MSIVLDALEAAAEAGDDAITRGIGHRRTSSARRVTETRQTIRRFLEAVPEDMTAMQLLQEIEGQG